MKLTIKSAATRGLTLLYLLATASCGLDPDPDPETRSRTHELDLAPSPDISGTVPTPGGSCRGDDGTLYCGEMSPDGCFCDDLCDQFADRCPDKALLCGTGPP